MLKTILRCAAILASATLLACQDESPGPMHLGGQWRGMYTNSAAFHADQRAIFTFTQSGAVVSGQMTLSGGTIANISGTIDGIHFTGTISFTGACPGIAASEASLVRQPLSRLDGTYQLTDCNGATTGTYTLFPNGTTS